MKGIKKRNRRARGGEDNDGMEERKTTSKRNGPALVLEREDLLEPKKRSKDAHRPSIQSPTMDSNCSIQSRLQFLEQESLPHEEEDVLQQQKSGWQGGTLHGKEQRVCQTTCLNQGDSSLFPTRSSALSLTLHWCSRLEAITKHKHIFKAETMHLATDIHKRFLIEIHSKAGNLSAGVWMPRHQIYLLASLWIAMKLLECQCFVPGSFFMGKVSGTQPHMVRTAEMTITMSLKWRLMDPASMPHKHLEKL